MRKIDEYIEYKIKELVLLQDEYNSTAHELKKHEVRNWRSVFLCKKMLFITKKLKKESQRLTNRCARIFTNKNDILECR